MASPLVWCVVQYDTGVLKQLKFINLNLAYCEKIQFNTDSTASVQFLFIIYSVSV